MKKNDKEKFDVCEYCCKWFREVDGKSPIAVKDAYPKMMCKVLKEEFGIPNEAARSFVENACYGNWERLHLTAIEKEIMAKDVAETLTWDVFYCSDRWSWDRVLRIQWLYQVLKEKVRKEQGE